MVLGFVGSLVNGRGFVPAIVAGVQFSITVAAVVAIINWVTDIARRKGYSPWLRVFLVVLLQILGMVILLFLPHRHRARDHGE